MTLAGLTVAVTASRRASELAALISNRGGTPYVAPTVGIQLVEQLDKATMDIVKRVCAGEVEYAIFMTGPGSFAFLRAADELGMKEQLIGALNKVHVVARSSKPARVLKAHGVHVDLVPSDNTSEGIAKEMKLLDLRGKTVMVLWHGELNPTLNEQLETQGARILDATYYRYSLYLGGGGEKTLKTMGFKPIPPEIERVIDLIANIRRELIHVITFTSPPAARNLFRIAANHNLDAQLKQDLNRNVVVVAVGPVTKGAVETNGVNVDVIPENYKLGSMIKALEDYIGNGKAKAIAVLERIDARSALRTCT